MSTGALVSVQVESGAISEAEARVLVPHAFQTRTVAAASKTHLMGGAWTWEQLRDYVVAEMQARWGARPRDPLKESGIFKGFCNRWGDKAEAIARSAFEVHNGIWRGAPIAVERFAKGSDPYFAEVLARNI